MTYKTIHTNYGRQRVTQAEDWLTACAGALTGVAACSGAPVVLVVGGRFISATMVASKLTDHAMLKYFFLIAACAASGFLSGSFAAHFPGDSSAWASWAPVPSAFVAIIGAYVVGMRQSKMTLEAVKDAHEIAESLKARSRYAAVRAAHSRAVEIRRAVESGEPPLNVSAVYHSSIIDSLVLALNGISASDLGDEKAVDALIVMSGQFVFLRTAMERYVAGPFSAADVMSDEYLRKRGYEEKHVDDVIRGARAARKANVMVYLDRIDIEFDKLRLHFEPSLRCYVGGQRQ